MLPATSTGRGCSARIDPVSAVVVVLPFVPVIAIVSASVARQPSSSSPITGTPAARAAAASGASTGTPGLTTTRSARRTAASASRSRTTRMPSVTSARASAPSVSIGFASVPSTVAPQSRNRRAAATPLRASPTTTAVRPASESRYALPRTTAVTSSMAISTSNSEAEPWRRSSELQRGQGEEGERERDDPEPHDDLRLGTSFELVMVMERRHPEDTLAGELEAGDLDDDRGGLDDVEPADQRQEQLGLGQHGQRPDGGAERQRADVAHEDFGRMTVEPEKADRGPDQRAAEDRQLAGAPHVQDLEIVGGAEVAGQVRDHAERARGHDDRSHREPVETVGQVHRIRRADDDDHRDGNPPPPEVHEPALQEGNGEDGGPVPRMLPEHHLQDAERQQHLQPELRARRQALARAQLRQVVQQADQAEAERGEHRDPDVPVPEIPPEQRG